MPSAILGVGPAARRHDNGRLAGDGRVVTRKQDRLLDGPPATRGQEHGTDYNVRRELFRNVPAADVVDGEGRDEVCVVADAAVREIEDGEHQLQRVRRGARTTADRGAVDEERRLAGDPLDGVRVEVGQVDREADRLEVLGTAGSRMVFSPIPTAVDSPGTIASPKISITQISPPAEQRSSSPAIHSDIDRGLISARACSSTYPPFGVQPQNGSCSSLTTRPSRYGCWPTVLPTGPEKLPDWIPDTRRSGLWSPPHPGPGPAGC